MKKVLNLLFCLFITILFSNLANAGKITIGISADYPPFDMMIDGQVSGFDADIAKHIAKELNQELVIKEIDFAGLIPALNAGIIDFAISNIAATPERRQIADFTIPYYLNKAAIVYSKHHQFDKLTNIAKIYKIGVQLGTNFHDHLKLHAKNEIVALSRIPILFEELRQGKIDYLVLDDIQADYFIKQNADKFQQTQLVEFNGEISIALKLGSSLTPKINNIIQKLHDQGTIKELEQKWLVDYNISNQTSSKTNVFNINNVKFIAEGITVTITYAVLAALFGLLISLALTIISQKNIIGRYFTQGYISIIRGTPLILQLSLIYFGIPSLFDIKIPIMTAGLIGFSINSAAYIFEHIKAGIKSIEKGQIDAAKAMGIPQDVITKIIIIPQAIRNITPSIINEIINLIKETSIISIFGVSDIMRRANIIASESYDFITPLLIAGLSYYIIITIFSLILNKIEKKLR